MIRVESTIAKIVDEGPVVPLHFYERAAALARAGGSTRTLAKAAREFEASQARSRASRRLSFRHAGLRWYSVPSVFGVKVYARRADDVVFLMAYD